MRRFKIVVEHHPDGYIAYPLGMRGIVIGEGDNEKDAIRDVQSAIAFHEETFGPNTWLEDDTVIEATVVEAGV